jgi:hypothetical protein
MEDASQQQAASVETAVKSETQEAVSAGLPQQPETPQELPTS